MDEVVLLARLGQNVARLRKAAGIPNQDELARRAGVSRTTINRLEKGKVNVKVTDLIAVARTVGGTVAELLDEDQALIAERAARILDDPNFTSGMVRLGGAYRRMGDRDRARTIRVLAAMADDANSDESSPLAQKGDQNGPSRG